MFRVSSAPPAANSPPSERSLLGNRERAPRGPSGHFAQHAGPNQSTDKIESGAGGDPEPGGEQASGDERLWPGERVPCPKCNGARTVHHTQQNARGVPRTVIGGQRVVCSGCGGSGRCAPRVRTPEQAPV